MLDLNKVDSVEILIDDDGRVWVNVDGECKLRVKKAKYVTVDTPVINEQTEFKGVNTHTFIFKLT